VSQRQHEKSLPLLKNQISGLSTSQIHSKTGYPRSTIRSFLNRHTLNPVKGFENEPGRRAMRRVKPQGERNLLRIANQDTRMTLKALATPSKSGVKLHPRTVAKILKFHGKAKRRPRKKPFLTEDHKRRRRVHYKAEKAMKRDNRKVC
jgi:transposase